MSFSIFEGTSEIQRMIIGRAVTGLDGGNNRWSWRWCGSWKGPVNSGFRRQAGCPFFLVGSRQFPIAC
jgi:hypothetical protein